MSKSYKTIAVAILVSVLGLTFSGCATIPPESVALSKKISSGILKSQTAHLSTINAFYNQLNKSNDKWIVDVYVPKLVTEATADLSAACKGAGDESESCTKLNNNDIKRIISRTIEFRDEIQRALTKSRDEATNLVNEHYRDLLTANAGVTTLLASAVDLSAATQEATTLASEMTGITIDTDAIGNAINNFLEIAGTEAVEIADLEMMLSS